MRGRILGGNFEDYSNLIKLGEILNTVHALGRCYPITVEPCDLDVNPERHFTSNAVSAAPAAFGQLARKYPQSHYLDYSIGACLLGQERMLDAIEIVQMMDCKRN